MDLRQQLETRREDLAQGVSFLRQQIAEIEEMLEKRKIDLFVTDGALRECNYWIDQLTSDEVDIKHYSTDQDVEGMDQ